MPGKLFGLDLRRSAQLLDKKTKASPKASPTNTPLASPLIEPSSQSMDNLMRPVAMMKKHGSDKKDKERSLSKDKQAKDSKHPPPPRNVKLEMLMESPPVVLYGTPVTSTGALISGRLQVTPTASDVTLNTITMYLEATAETKHPVAERCRECMTKVDDLYEWNFLTKPKTFEIARGTQELPFSHLIPGHITATTHGKIGSIDYSLHVRARTDQGQEIEFRRGLVIQRALIPGPDKSSIRVFPPTNVTIHITLPNVVHPIGDFIVQCRMNGIVTKQNDSQTRWRLRKVTWKIEEHEKTVEPACDKHKSKVGENKALQHESTRDVGSDELKSGWKTHFEDDLIEGEFKAAVNSGLKPQCDVDALKGLNFGIKIDHSFVVELVIAEEFVANKKPQQATPTGAARVLRTHVNLNLTERAGMGISWDEEQPPQYSEVPASPPHYGNQFTSVEDYHGDDLHDDIEHLNLGQ